MISFNNSEFELIFPFYVRIGSDLRIISTGKSITKVIGNVDRRSFEEIFKFIRPSMSIKYDFQSMMKHQDIIIILESLEFPIKTRFRGQFIFREIENEIIYLNSPWITDSHDLGFHNLLISDFALHDTITDNLQLLKSKQIVNEDMKKIADEMIIQRNELIKKNETIEELARFPDQNPQPILRIDFDGKVLYTNDPGAQLINQQNLLTLPFWETIYLSFEANGYTSFESEFALEESIFHATIVPFKKKSYFNIYLRDITETLSFQNDLINTSSRLQTLISNMNSAILAEDAERKIILTNQIFCDLFNVPIEPDQMKGIDCNEASEVSKLLFTDEQGFIDRINELLRNKKKVYGDILNMKDGRVLERDYLPVFEEDEYTGHIWKYQDVTDLMQTKASLQKVEEKYKKIIENLKVGLIEVDLEQNITKVYPAFCQMTGYSEDELLGANAYKLLVTDEDRKSLEYQNNARKKGISGVYETRIKVKDGAIKWVIISGAPIYDMHNNVVGSLGVHVDISERKKMEEDLVEANEKAMSSIKLKEMFVANMSHEIRTPMNVIIGMLDLIGDEGLDPERKKYIQTIKRSASALLELINDLLDFSKIEAGELQIEETNVNLFELFQYLDFSFSETAKNKGIQLLSEVDQKISEELISDNTKLNQVMVNLINNAVKFTANGFVRFQCQLIEDNENHQHIKFAVSDTGIGIANENFNTIFQTFMQEDSSVSRKYGGTGLGLSISKEIVSRLGGEIELQSEKGKGSTFSFELTLRKGVKKKMENSSIEINMAELGHLHILVAEDNPLNQILISSIFAKHKVNYDLVENGEEVIVQLTQKKYDLILMDIQMPLMDGVSAAKHIRQTLGMNIPIIALTANASKEDEALYRSVGMNAYLAKPFKKETLFQLIEMLVEGSGQIEVQSNERESVQINALYSLKEIEDISGGDGSFVQSIIETFRTNTPKYLNEITIGIAKNNIELIKRNAHQLKPSLDILCITEGSRLIRIIEEEANKSTVDKNLIASSFNQVKNILDAVLRDLYSKF
jgi:PAS domain S-box-containing protein